jgi:predicted nucleic acid-binding protein
MPAAKLFLDSSALVAGAASETGAARALLVLAEAGQVDLVVAEQIIVETERVLARKLPGALPAYRPMLVATRLKIVRDPAPGAIAKHRGLIVHEADLPVLVAAMQASVDYLVTLNRKHFLDDPNAAARSGLRIGSPADALVWLRSRWSGGPDEIE